MKRHNTFQSEIHLIRSIRKPVLRDLVALLWANCPFNDQIPDELCFHAPQLKLEELIQWAEEIEIEEQLDANKLPLGKYAEQLLQIFFKNYSVFQLLGQNIQLIKDKETLGEIDFLLHDLKQNNYIHLEFALKFYLKTAWKGKEIFLGPHVKDCLQRKSQKLINRQSQLLNQHADLLTADLHKIPFQPKIWVKGVRFYPFRINESYTHAKAWWIKIEDIGHLDKSNYTFELINQKKDWIFPYFKAVAQDFETLKLEAKTHLSQNRNPLMVVRKKGKKVVDRGFVMRADWPN
jgi:hypothetical protein